MGILPQKQWNFWRSSSSSRSAVAFDSGVAPGKLTIPCVMIGRSVVADIMVVLGSLDE